MSDETTASPRSQRHTIKAHLDTPGMAVAMAYGFVAYEDTVEYKMENWYKTEKDHMMNKSNTKQSPKKAIGEHNKYPMGSHGDIETHQNTSDDHTQQQIRCRRNSQLKNSLKSKLDDIPEAFEEH